ncbi:MAG: ApaG protein [Saprospiraceae bacterium]|jgi:ApaG protein
MKNITENKNIVIVVKTQFEAEFSRADVPSFIFSYKIQITNNNSFPVKIEKREWMITDSNGEVIMVKGDGVVGLTPEIAPNGKFEYSSNVNLKSGLGNMKGKFLMINNLTEESFYAEIPEFKLEAEFMLN